MSASHRGDFGLGFLSMHRNLVLTLTGPDRIGIVEEVTGLLVARGGNVEVSRMARLAGEFAMLMLVAIPPDRADELEADLNRLTGQGYKVTTVPARQRGAEAHHGWLPFRIAVQGADHEGIIQEVAAYLAQRGITIESAESETTPAPISAVPLFTMTAEVLMPPEQSATGWQAGLDELGGRLNVEIAVETGR